MTGTSKPRYPALDVLRGMTVCFMIIVNTPGSGAEPFSPLNHARWHGFTPTDLVFPSFLFVVGNAMAFSMGKLREMATGDVVMKVLRRTFIIFLLGFLMYWFPFFRPGADGNWHFSPFSHTRIFGVLQRIGLCYGIASLMILFLPKRTVWTVSGILLLGYWALLYFGGDYTMLGNLGTTIDKAILGEAHMYHGEGVAFDPEGILSTLPAIVNVVIGYYTGSFIKEKGNGYETIARLMVAGAALIAGAYFWDLVFPINKKLWTSPFVLYTCGLDLLILGSLIYVTEVLGRKRWTGFFEVFGKNPLSIYLLSELLVILLFVIHVGDKSIFAAINDAIFQKIAPGPIGSLLFAVCYMLLCWSVGKIMDMRKVYIRV